MNSHESIVKAEIMNIGAGIFDLSPRQLNIQHVMTTIITVLYNRAANWYSVRLLLRINCNLTWNELIYYVTAEYQVVERGSGAMKWGAWGGSNTERSSPAVGLFNY